MKFLMGNTSNNLSQSFTSLLQVIREDEEMNTRVIQMLKLKSFQRTLLLNKWLEQLRRKKASEKLLRSLACLFDDAIADKVLTLINNKTKNPKADRSANEAKF